jgi:tetratricopeptide (TPR) repeat protein
LGGAAAPASTIPAFNADVLLAAAIQAHDSGRLAEAERGYRAALALAPRDARVPAHLGVLLLEQGRNAEGVALLDQSLALDPRQPGMLTNKGNALVALGRVAEALDAYGQAIAQQSAADQPGAYNNLGVYLQSLKLSDDAATAYERALALDPAFPEAWGNLGVAHLTAERAQAALEALDRAVALKPDYPDAWTNRGTALQKMNRLDEALESFDRALALRPDSADVWTNRSLTLQGLRRFDESFEASAKAVSMGEGADADSWNNHGVALQTLHRFEEAVDAYDRALTADPEGASAWNNRGLALQGLGRFEEAVASFDRAIALKPDYADAHWNKALVLILLGDYEAGWPLFEWRWKRSEPGAEKPLDFGAPPWLGQAPIAGKTLLLHAEQGFGDSIQMLRYVPLLAARGAKVTLIAPEPLIELAATVEGLGAEPKTGGLMSFDLHVPLMSLPLAMNTRLDTVPRDTPYLSVPERARAAWSERLGPAKRRRVGLAWAGNPDHNNDHNRSLAFDVLRPLLDADVEFHSLLKTYRPGEREALAADGRIHDHSAALDSFADTAALIDRMDMVVAVDTSTAHLAGALGKPLLLLLPFIPDCRWGLNRDDSPWYPTARLLRQDAAGDWTGVIRAAAAALRT